MRTDPLPSADERTLLIQYLDYQRETILRKTDDLTHAQMRLAHPPSRLTLGGLLNHLALVEDPWCQVRFSGLPEREPWASVNWDDDRDWEFHTAGQMVPGELRQRYREACERSDEAVTQVESLDQLSATALKDGRHFSLRWMLLHLIDETARHAGHADLIREALDGAVGD